MYIHRRVYIFLPKVHCDSGYVIRTFVSYRRKKSYLSLASHLRQTTLPSPAIDIDGDNFTLIFTWAAHILGGPGYITNNFTLSVVLVALWSSYQVVTKVSSLQPP